MSNLNDAESNLDTFLTELAEQGLIEIIDETDS
jgi:hypothetical protein